MLSRVFFFLLFCFLHLPSLSFCMSSESSNPIPVKWPNQFHAILLTNTSKGTFQKNDYWYDWPNGRELLAVQNQLGDLIFNLNWRNGTSVGFTLNPNRKCTVKQLESSRMLSPDFFQYAAYLGQEIKDGFVCNVWKKAIITYYESVTIKKPVYWRYDNGFDEHVITFEAGRVMGDESGWQAPAFCFNKSKVETM